MKIYVFTVCYEDEIDQFRKLAALAGAHVEFVQKIPYRNYAGQHVGLGQWAIVYASTKQLEMEVKT